jgi:hypothetical protein
MGAGTVPGMGWRSWLGRVSEGAAAGRKTYEERLPDAEVLAIVAERLNLLGGGPWLADGEWGVRGPGRTAVVLGADHVGSVGHLDLHFVVDTGIPGETVVPDCATGYGGTVRDKVSRAVETWASTTAVTLLELAEPKGRFATHLPVGGDDGFPGRHAIHGGIVGWSTGPDHGAVRDWAADHPLLPALAPALPAGRFSRDYLVGVKFFFGSRDGEDMAEVRVNGQVSKRASRALLGLDWPRTDSGVAYARTFALLVHPG